MSSLHPERYGRCLRRVLQAGEIAHLQPQASNKDHPGQTTVSFQELGSKIDRELLRHGFSSIIRIASSPYREIWERNLYGNINDYLRKPRKTLHSGRQRRNPGS